MTFARRSLCEVEVGDQVCEQRVVRGDSGGETGAVKHVDVEIVVVHELDEARSLRGRVEDLKDRVDDLGRGGAGDAQTSPSADDDVKASSLAVGTSGMAALREEERIASTLNSPASTWAETSG